MVQYFGLSRENSGFLGDRVVSAPAVRRAAIPCNRVLRREMRLPCAGLGAALLEPSPGFFGDFRGREMAAGVQATGIGDDWETERAYLNMEAR